MVDDEAAITSVITALLKSEGYHVHSALRASQALEMMLKEKFDLVISDIRMKPINGFDLLRTARRRHPEIEFIVMTAYGSAETAIEAMRLGVFDYITKPFKVDDLMAAVTDSLAPRETDDVTVDSFPDSRSDGLVARSQAMRDVCTVLEQASPTDSSVLIEGDVGTGKERVARAMHEHSARRGMRFDVVNCSAFSAQDLESELFGHREGAIDGATSDKQGVLETAHGGTVFLKDVDTVPPGVQVKLLHALESGEIRRAGSDEPVPTDVRVLSSAGRKIEPMVAQDKFMRDLYSKLGIIRIGLSPLRDRVDDILPLACHMLRKGSATGVRAPVLSREVCTILEAHQWPENGDELERVLAYAVTHLVGGRMIGRIDRGCLPAPLAALQAWPRAVGRGKCLQRFLEWKEKEYLRQVWRQTGGDPAEATEITDIQPDHLGQKLLKYKKEPSSVAEASDQGKRPAPVRRPKKRSRGRRDGVESRSVPAGALRPPSGAVETIMPAQASAPENENIYPYVVGGLIHDTLNTIGALDARLHLLRRGGEEHIDLASAMKEIRRLERDTDHLQRVLELIQSMSREYYKPSVAASDTHVDRIEGLVGRYRDNYANITYESHIDLSCNTARLPLGVTTFLVGELLTNASRACAGAGGGTVSLSAGCTSMDDVLQVECRDTGPGFSEEILERIRAGRVRAPRAPGKGGYGLYLMLQVVQRLEGGSFLVSNMDPNGARIQILLPMRGGIA